MLYSSYHITFRRYMTDVILIFLMLGLIKDVGSWISPSQSFRFSLLPTVVSSHWWPLPQSVIHQEFLHICTAENPFHPPQTAQISLTLSPLGPLYQSLPFSYVIISLPFNPRWPWDVFRQHIPTLLHCKPVFFWGEGPYLESQFSLRLSPLVKL